MGASARPPVLALKEADHVDEADELKNCSTEDLYNHHNHGKKRSMKQKWM